MRKIPISMFPAVGFLVWCGLILGINNHSYLFYGSTFLACLVGTLIAMILTFNLQETSL